MDRKLLGKRIADRRNYMKMTQEDLSALINVTREAVSNWETGRRGLDAADMQRLATALDTTVGYFYGEDDILREDSPSYQTGEGAVMTSRAGDMEKRLANIEGQLQELLERFKQDK